MEPSVLGLVLDSSVLIAAERRNLPPDRVFCAITLAEVGHGIYRANSAELRDRRRSFLDELKATVPILPVSQATAEIIARVGGEQASRGTNLPLADLIIGACALELGYAVGTGNPRDFGRIPGLQLVEIRERSPS